MLNKLIHILINIMSFIDVLIDKLYLFIFYPNLTNTITDSINHPITDSINHQITDSINHQITDSINHPITKPLNNLSNDELLFDKLKKCIISNNVELFEIYCKKVNNLPEEKLLELIELISSHEKTNNLDLINFLHCLDPFQFISNTNILNMCIQFNDMKLIKCLRKEGYNWNIYSFSYGASTQNLELMQWLKDDNCFWGIMHDKHKKIILSNEKLVKWLKENNCPWVDVICN
jgi:hypothetical protein